jgi:uncharacterized damage-inducible protein DinB
VGPRCHLDYPQHHAQPPAEIFRYNKWANRTLLDACRHVSDQQLDTTVPNSDRSIRQTLLHIVGGQRTFVLRTSGRQLEGELTDLSPWPGFDSLIDRAKASSDDLIAIAESLETERKVDLPYFGKTYRFPVSFFLAHTIAHSTQHREQVLMTMASLGLDPPDLDGWPYAAAANHGNEV